MYVLQIPESARSKASVWGRSLARIAGSNPAVAWILSLANDVFQSGIGLCNGLITRPEEFY
jgi:hypothetical protein